MIHTTHTTSTVAQTFTPEVLAWLASQSALGCTRPSLFKSLVDAGWPAASACDMMQLTEQERMAFGGLHTSPQAAQAMTCAVVPVIQLDSTGTMSDAGDKWVEVPLQLHAPEVMVLSQFLSAAECDALVEAARPRMSRSLTVDIQTGGEALHPDRTSQGMFFTRSENALVKAIEARIAKVLAWPVQNGEGLQVLRYPPGAQYKPHYDYFDPTHPGSATILKRGGQRVATVIMYLHTPEAGGATIFPDIAFQVAPLKGNAVFFSYAQAHPDSKTLHGGEPVGAGEKWIATKWLREREFV